MTIERKDFPSTLPDNDENYFSLLEAVISSIDELCNLVIIRTLTGYQFRIAPSNSSYLETLIQEIIKLHNLMNIRLDFSKSMKTSVSLSFHIDIKNQQK